MAYNRGYNTQNSNTNVESETKRKKFDPTICFTFFGTWMKQILEIKEKYDCETAMELVEAIGNAAMYDEEPDFSDRPLLEIIWPSIQRDIDNSVSRRKSQFDKDELNENHSRIKAALIDDPKASHRQIAKDIGVSPSTVDRVYHKNKNEIDEAILEAEKKEELTAAGVRPSTFYEKDIGEGNAAGNDTVRQGSEALSALDAEYNNKVIYDDINYQESSYESNNEKKPFFDERLQFMFPDLKESDFPF